DGSAGCRPRCAPHRARRPPRAHSTGASRRKGLGVAPVRRDCTGEIMNRPSSPQNRTTVALLVGAFGMAVIAAGAGYWYGTRHAPGNVAAAQGGPGKAVSPPAATNADVA